MSNLNGSGAEEDPEVVVIDDSEEARFESRRGVNLGLKISPKITDFRPSTSLTKAPCSGSVVAHPVLVDEVDDEVIVVEAEKAKTPIVEPMPGPSSVMV